MILFFHRKLYAPCCFIFFISFNRLKIQFSQSFYHLNILFSFLHYLSYFRSLAELTHNLLQERGSALQTPIPRSSSQEANQFRVPGKVMRRSPSQRSYCSQLRTLSGHSSSQELRVYDQSQLAPVPPELRNDLALQDLPYRGRTAPLSPSQHSVSSQETVPFRLPPHHPLANAHLALQQHPISEEPYNAQNYKACSENLVASVDRGIQGMTPADSGVLQEEVPFQNPNTAVADHSNVSTTPRDFRMPRIPSQQVLTPEDRPASWASRHSSASSGSRSSLSNKSSHRSSVRSESLGSAASASSKHFIASGNSFQAPAYNKPSTVRLLSQNEHQQYPATSAASKLHHNPYVVEEDSSSANRLCDETSSYRSATPRSYYSEYSVSRDAVQQGSFVSNTVSPQLHFQQAESVRDFAAPHNPSPQQQEHQQPQDKGFIRVSSYFNFLFYSYCFSNQLMTYYRLMVPIRLGLIINII